MAAKVMSGARAKVAIYDPVSGQAKVVGIWNSFSYSVSIDVSPCFVLGRYSAAELSTTAVEPVNITASGWRVVGHGPFAEGRIIPLDQMLTQEYLVLTVVDRQTGLTIATINGCLPTGFSSTLSARQLQDSSNTYQGLLMDDESTINAEATSATNLP